MFIGILFVRFIIFTTVMPFLQPRCFPFLRQLLFCESTNLSELKVRRLVVFSSRNPTCRQIWLRNSSTKLNLLQHNFRSRVG
ncbi:hypothetical protein QL285_038480 [Trifolium repens]|nr:hypothetical protein QL285_038480 [Trifolium repens]